MTKLMWDQTGQRLYETGVDHGVLYIPDSGGLYNSGYAWNGLTTVTESPTGAESNPQYADNIKYLNLTSAEEFGATVEAFTYPDEFAQCDGTAVPEPGVSVGQQSRKVFGLSYRTKVGNDLDGQDFGYKLHLIYGALAAPSEKAYATINDSPTAISFSWAVTTTPVDLPGYKPTASITLDSTKVDADALSALEDMLYGTAGADPELPLPADVLAIFAGTITEVVPVKPTNAGNVITIPTVTGIEYRVEGAAVTGSYTMTEDVVVTAHALAGYRFPDVSDSDWYYDFT